VNPGNHPLSAVGEHWIEHYVHLIVEGLYTEFSVQGCVTFNHHILRSNVILFSACVIKICVNQTAYVSDLAVSFNLCLSTPPEVLLGEKLPTSSMLTCVSQAPCQDLSLIMVDIIGNSLVTSDVKKCVPFLKRGGRIWQFLHMKLKLNIYTNE